MKRSIELILIADKKKCRAIFERIIRYTYVLLTNSFDLQLKSIILFFMYFRYVDEISDNSNIFTVRKLYLNVTLY